MPKKRIAEFHAFERSPIAKKLWFFIHLRNLEVSWLYFRPSTPLKGLALATSCSATFWQLLLFGATFWQLCHFEQLLTWGANWLNSSNLMHLSMVGMGRGFDCVCWPWVRALDWSCSPRGGDVWIFLRPTWRYLTVDSDEKDWDRTYVSRFHASRMRRTVWKDQEVMEANENKRRLSGFHCFVFKFRLF